MRVVKFFIWAILLSGCRDKTNTLTVLFDNVEGLSKGSNVYYKSIIVGEVSDLELFKDQVIVDITLKDSILIPVASKFIINPSIFGSAHITIVPSNHPHFLSSKNTITG